MEKETFTEDSSVRKSLTVVFVLSTQDEKVQAQCHRAVKHLQEQGIRSEIRTEEDAIRMIGGLHEEAGSQRNAREIAKRTEAFRKTLFLSDRSGMLEKLKKEGACAIALSHAKNRAEAFSGISYIFAEVDEVEADSYVKAYEREANLPWQILETGRLQVRETTVQDIEAFYRIYAGASITRFMEGLFPDPQDERRYTEDYIRNVYGLLGFGVWTVVEKASGEIVGRAGFSIRNGFEEVELGFLIGEPWQRKGYAKEVCQAILQYGKEVLGFSMVMALVKKENTVSIHLLQELGFVVTEEVEIEENIYGNRYLRGEEEEQTKQASGTVALTPTHFGSYLKMKVQPDKEGAGGIDTGE